MTIEMKPARLGCLVVCADGRGKAFRHHRTRRLEPPPIEGEERRRDQRAPAKSVLRVGRSGERVFEPAQPLGPVSTDLPESRECGTESEPEHGIPVALAPGQSGPEVVELGFDAVEPARLIRSPEHRPGTGLGKVREPLGVLAPKRLRLGRRDELVQRVLARGLQQPIGGAMAARSLMTQEVTTNLRRRVTTSVRSIPSPTQTASTSSREKDPDITESLRNRTRSGSDNRS